MSLSATSSQTPFRYARLFAGHPLQSVARPLPSETASLGFGLERKGKRVTIASALLDRVLHPRTVMNIKGESYRLKERKEFMRQKQRIVNTLFEQGNA